MKQTILITGASQGIGQATAQALANKDTHLILSARNLTHLEKTDDLVRNQGGSATLISHDLRNFPGIQEMATNLAQRYTRLDGLILNGGTLGHLQSLEDLDPLHFGEVIETNLVANFLFLKTFAPLLRAGQANVLALTTGAVPHPRAYWGAYAASKAGLEALTLTFAQEMGPKMQVNLFDPGRVRTRMRATAYPGEDPMNVRPADEIGEIIARLMQDPNLGTGQRLHADDY